MPYLRVNGISLDRPTVLAEKTTYPRLLTVKGYVMASISIPKGARIEMCGDFIGIRGIIIGGDINMVRGDSLDITWKEGNNDDVFEVMTAKELLNGIDADLDKELRELVESVNGP